MKPNIKINYEVEKSDARAIRIWAVANEMTLDEVAKKLGISRQYLNLILNRKTKVSHELFKKMEKLGIFNEGN